MARFFCFRRNSSNSTSAFTSAARAGAGNHGARRPRRTLLFIPLLIIALVFSAIAGATTYTISPGQDSLQYYVTNRAKHASGDVIILRNGTYTATAASNFVIMTSGFTGHAAYTKLTIQAQNPGLAILDFSNVTNDAIFGGDAAGVTLKDLTFSGSPGTGNLRDLAGSAYTNWTFDGIRFTNSTKTGIQLTQATGVGITLKNLSTTSTFSGPFVVNISGPNSDLDLLIDGVDGRVHARATPNNIAKSPMTSVVLLQNVHDARVRNIRGDYMSGIGLDILSNNNAIQTKNIYVSDVWITRSTDAGVHVGNTTAAVARTSNVHLRNIRVENCANGYGIEFENSVSDCSLNGYTVIHSQRMGAVIAEDTENIQVSGGFVTDVADSIFTYAVPGDGHVTSAAIANQSAGLVMSTGRRHRMTNNVVLNCVRGVVETNDTTQVNPADGGSFSGTWVPAQRNVIRENVFIGCSYIYGVSSNSMPYGGGRANAHMIGPNYFSTPSVAFAFLNNSTTLTQAQFESQFAHNIDKSDVLGASMGVYTKTEAANRLLFRGATWGSLTFTEVLNLLALAETGQ